MTRCALHSHSGRLDCTGAVGKSVAPMPTALPGQKYHFAAVLHGERRFVVRPTLGLRSAKGPGPLFCPGFR